MWVSYTKSETGNMFHLIVDSFLQIKIFDASFKRFPTFNLVLQKRLAFEFVLEQAKTPVTYHVSGVSGHL